LAPPLTETAPPHKTTPTKGVDGKNVYLYGESWDFGEVALNARGRNATQHNTGGTGLGSFNDRLRDGAMGGSPYHPPDTQGFVTGLHVDPNERAQREGAALRAAAEAEEAEADGAAMASLSEGGAGEPIPPRDLLELLERTDWVRYSLAGNLADYATTAASAGGAVLAGRALRYHGNQPLCYGRLPCEHIAYVGCHDNETIFDQVAMRLPLRSSADDRARACRLAVALSVLSIGVPFIHAGDDLLRSKSLDRDSYDSGDWFNAIDWTGNLGNGFGRGLPPASKNAGQWPAKRKLLRDAGRVAPTPAMRRAAARYCRALLRARYSSPLFRMADAAHVCAQVKFCNTGPDQTPGVIVMVLTSAPASAGAGGSSSSQRSGGGGSGGGGSGTHDERHASVVCVFNARPEPHECPFPAGAEGGTGVLRLHPALEALRGGGGKCGAERDEAVEGCYADAGARRLVVAARTAAVFVEDWA
jgi:pullulanase/glycogen debranching enzyme